MFQSDVAGVIGHANAWAAMGKNHSAFMASEFVD
jgi:hypothetical protein